MRKVLSVLVCILLTMPAFATGSATPTSKGYVDAQMDTLQDNLPGAAAITVLTTTATAGETGTKAIYDASGNYAEQQSALVTAEVANTAIQMAIQGELVCREYDPTGQYCYVYDVRHAIQSLLPTGYTAVEYIQGNGSGTINTGVIFNSGTLKYSIDIYSNSLTDYTSSYYGENDVIGNFTKNNATNGFVGGVYCGPYLNDPKCTDDNAYFFNYVDPKNLHQSSATNAWHTLETEFADNTMTFTLAGNSHSIERTRYHNSSPIVLMGGSETYMPAASRIKIRNIKIWHNNQLVRNYITCRNADNVYGVYDLINNTFTGTTNGTALTGGPDLNVYMPMGQ